MSAEYPKALYPGPDQRLPYVVAHGLNEEQALRETGAKTLAEWWESTGVPDCEPDEWAAKLAARPPASTGRRKG